jgi:exodeoxyribonuclease VII large subunit
MNERVRRANLRSNELIKQLSPARLQVRVAAARSRFDSASTAVTDAVDGHLQKARERLGLAAASLDALSPLSVLQRGYAIAEDASGKVLRDVAAVEVGDEVGVRLLKGKFKAKVSDLSDETLV